MSGVQGHLAAHIVRRGVEMASSSGNQQYVEYLNKQSNLYEEKGSEVKPWELLVPVVTGLIFMVLIASVRYTLGEVVASLAMIEQPTTTVIVSERKPPTYEDDVDAVLEKTPFIQDEEVVVIQEKPITASIRKSIQHLHRIGGFRARWRGLGASVMYHILHALFANTFGFALGVFFSGGHPVLQPVTYVMASVCLARIHMTWTHVMISKPSEKPWHQRISADIRPQTMRTPALPTLVFALAQQATIFFPAAIFISFAPMSGDLSQADTQKDLAFRSLTAIATAGAVAILVLLPASVTLTRIEASLLPEDQETIVSFDRTLGGVAVSAVALGTPVSAKAIFVAAWRSFDKPARLRLVKFYLKMVFIQTYLTVTAAMVVVGQIALIGPEKLSIFLQSMSAQLQLAAMGQQ